MSAPDGDPAMPCQIRPGSADDLPALCALFFEAVREGASRYSVEERRAWAPDVPSVADWTDRLDGHRIFVAERDGEIVGFMTLGGDGLVDLAFVRPAAQRTGVSSALYRAVEAAACEAGQHRLYADASLHARPFFQKHGWSVIEEKAVARHGETLTAFAMEKRLD